MTLFIKIIILLFLNINVLFAQEIKDTIIYDKSDGDNNGSIGKMNYQGYTYRVMMVGSRWWMTEGLRATKYNDGMPIENVKDKSHWYFVPANYKGAWCDYNNDPTIGNIYGKLYNYHAVFTGRLAPPGWRVANHGDWDKVKNQNFYKKLAGGCRFYNGNFHLVGKSGYFWATFTDFIGRTSLYYARFDYMGTEIHINYTDDKRYGYSVLCVKE